MMNETHVSLRFDVISNICMKGKFSLAISLAKLYLRPT